MQLLISALDTPIALALARDGEIIASATGKADDKSAALDEGYRALPPEKLNEIIVVNGPGNFTAIRASIGFARGLGVALGLPTRGIGVFDIDAALAPSDASDIYRDARGGRYYHARAEDGEVIEIQLINAPPSRGYTAEPIDDLTPITGDRMVALANLACRAIGTNPASANYIRPPDAALPSEPPLVILDD